VPIDLTVEGCADAVLVDMGDVSLESQGRIIQMDVTIQNVCPGKRVALAAILTEVDENGMEHQRGMKAMTIPAHSFPTCRDVLVKCIRFVVPEDLDVSGGSTVALCNPRKFKVRFLANNIDTDYRCCESVLTV
jgi:Ca-activated chloride channel family protein